MSSAKKPPDSVDNDELKKKPRYCRRDLAQSLEEINGMKSLSSTPMKAEAKAMVVEDFVDQINPSDASPTTKEFHTLARLATKRNISNVSNNRDNFIARLAYDYLRTDNLQTAAATSPPEHRKLFPAAAEVLPPKLPPKLIAAPFSGTLPSNSQGNMNRAPRKTAWQNISVTYFESVVAAKTHFLSSANFSRRTHYSNCVTEVCYVCASKNGCPYQCRYLHDGKDSPSNRWEGPVGFQVLKDHTCGDATWGQALKNPNRKVVHPCVKE